MLLSEWNHEILNDTMEQLSEPERAAISCCLSLSPKINIGKTRLKTYGFQSIPEYEAALSNARAHFKQYLRDRYGLTAISDLPFLEPEKTWDGRLAQRAGMTHVEYNKLQKARAAATVVEDDEPA